jgi:haloalkane dehalogenase
MLHGEPTWGYLWRTLIAGLSPTERVIVPDHMGFGKSEDPQDRSYLAEDHTANLASLLLDELDLHDITLVMHDWGGPIGTAFALRNPDRVRRLIALNTFLPLGLPAQSAAMAANLESAWFRWAAAASADGTLAQILGNAGHSVVHLMLALQTVARPEVVTPTWIRAYSAHFTGPDACRGVIRFPEQVVASATPDASPPWTPDPAAVEAIRAKPAMLAVGMQDTALLPAHVISAFRAAFPHAPVVELPDAGHFPQEDSPAALTALVQMFLQST